MSKLYATVSSEKAQKGQGGQNYLEIVITDINKNIICELRIERGIKTPLIRYWQREDAQKFEFENRYLINDIYNKQ